MAVCLVALAHQVARYVPPFANCPPPLVSAWILNTATCHKPSTASIPSTSTQRILKCFFPSTFIIWNSLPAAFQSPPPNTIQPCHWKILLHPPIWHQQSASVTLFSLCSSTISTQDSLYSCKLFFCSTRLCFNGPILSTSCGLVVETSLPQPVVIPSIRIIYSIWETSELWWWMN